MNGTLDQGSLTGTLKIFDTAYFDPADLTVLDNGQSYHFSDSFNEGQFTKRDGSLGLSSTLYDQGGDQLYLAFPETLLLNYNGGALCSLTNPCSIYVDSYFAFNGLGVHLKR